jgi:hypothetical protein
VPRPALPSRGTIDTLAENGYSASLARNRGQDFPEYSVRRWPATGSSRPIASIPSTWPGSPQGLPATADGNVADGRVRSASHSPGKTSDSAPASQSRDRIANSSAERVSAMSIAFMSRSQSNRNSSHAGESTPAFSASANAGRYPYQRGGDRLLPVHLSDMCDIRRVSGLTT